MGRKPGPKCLKEPLLPSAMFCLSAGPCYFAEWGSDIVSGVRIMGEAMEGGEEAGQSVRFRRRHTDLWPDEGALAVAWESEARIREVFRVNTSKLLSWPSRDLIGVASLKSLALNVDVVGKAIEVWGQSCQRPRTMSIDWLKQEVGFEFAWGM